MKKAFSILVSVAALVIAAPASASIGPSGWWPFYENTGTRAHDLSGNHDDGTLSGGARWTSGYFGPDIIGKFRSVNGGFKGGLLAIAAVLIVSGMVAVLLGSQPQRLPRPANS